MQMKLLRNVSDGTVDGRHLCSDLYTAKLSIKMK